MILCLPETFLARFPVSVMSSFIVPRAKRVFFLVAPPLVASAFGGHGRFPPHARKTSGYPAYQNDNVFWWEEENLCLNKRRQDKINHKLINNSFKNKVHYYITQMRFYRGTQRHFFGIYLFGRRFEISNFRNICCKISCLPASPKIFEHLKNGIIAQF